MARKRRLHKRYGKKRRNPERSSSPRHNPPLLMDLAEFIGPGFGGFAATRLLTRIAATQVATKRPTWAKHVGALASIASFALAWWGAGRVKWLEKYQTPIVVGSGIAAIQSIIQLYIPRLGWMIADATPEISSSELRLQEGTSQSQLPAGLEYVDDDDPVYQYNESYAEPKAAPANQQQTRASEEEAILADLNLDDDGSDLNLGSLGSN